MNATKSLTSSLISQRKNEPSLFLDQEGKGIKLSKKQKQLAALSYPLWAVCEVSALLLGKKKLTPRENTRRCYEDFFDPLCGETDVWPDYTEGYYPEGNETYDEAKLKQFDFILDKTASGPGSRILEIGCGNGKLAQRAMERQSQITGITVSREQAAACRNLGIDVRVCRFDNLVDLFEKESFDIIILNGPTEHFVTEEHEFRGQSDEVRDLLFKTCHKLLKAKGRIFITCIHFRYKTDIKKVKKHPLLHRIGSYNFQCSVLVKLYSGWYPYPGDYQKIAAKYGLKTVFERDATDDYLRTSINWSRRLKSFLAKNPSFAKKFVRDLYFKDPRYFFITYLFWVFDPWTWQFRGEEKSPMLHKWLMFEKTGH